MDWKEKFKAYLSPSGNMKRSLTTEQKTEVFQYRVREQYKVLTPYINNRVNVSCECVSCGLVSDVSPAKAVVGKAPCKVCAGKAKISTTGIPSYMENVMPKHVCIKGVHQRFRGVMWLDVDTIERDGFFIIEHKQRGLYSFATISFSLFQNPETAKLFLSGAVSNSRAMEIFEQEIPTLGVPKVLWRGWEHNKYAVWDTKLASIIKHCLEKRYKNQRVYLGYVDYAYKLTDEDLKELSEISDISAVLRWEL